MGGGSRVGLGGRVGGQGRCEQRNEVFVKIQKKKKKHFFFGGGGGGGQVGGGVRGSEVRVYVNEEFIFL